MMKGKKQPKSKEQPQASEDTFVPNADPQTKEMIQSALVEYLKEKLEEKNVTRKNFDALVSVVEEFLNSFIILGYTFEGQPIQYICAHNQQQADSLATLVNKFFQAAIERETNSDDTPQE